MEYVALKQIHVACVALSWAGFFLRGLWMMRASPLLDARWVRVAPHAVDTVLLASAIALAVMLRQYPFVHGWLTVKVCLLVMYIVLGSFALKRGRTAAVRLGCFIAAVAVYLFIASVARAHNPLGIFA